MTHAQEVAPEPPRDAALRARAQRAMRRRLIALAVGLPVLAVAAALLGAGMDSDGRRVSRGTTLVSLAIVLSVVAASIVGTLLVLRRRGFLTMTPAAGLDRRNRRQLHRALRRGAPIAPENRAMAVELVVKTRRLRWFPILFLVLGLFQLPHVGDGGARGWLAIAVCAAELALVPWVFWVQHRVGGRTDLVPRPPR